MIDWKNFFNDFADRYYAVPDFNNKQHVYALQNYLIEQGMLTEDVDYAVKVLLGEAPSKPNPKVAKQAKQMGLVFLGFGNWGKKKGGPATHKNADGKLVPVGDKEPEDDKEKKDDDKEKGGDKKPEDDDKPINLAKGGKVALVGFGSFSISARAAREGRNPQTGKTIQIAAKNVVKFKAGADLSGN